MDWQDNYQPGRDEGDTRPKTAEEMRQRNARRTRPELDGPAQDRRRGPERSRRKRPGAGGAASGGRRGPVSGAGKPNGERKDRRGKAAASRAPEKRTRRKQRRQRPAPEAEIHWSEPKPFIRRVFFWKLAATAAVVLAVMIGFTIFFKVGRISVSGTEKYTPEAVLEASGIEKGENLLTLGKAKRAGNILAALPYVKEVQIGIKLPDTVNINIVELAVTYAIADTEGRYWLMDSDGKLIEGVSEADAQTHTMVTGLVIQNPQPGKTIEPMEDILPGETDPDPTAETDGETAAAEETIPLVTAPNEFTGSNVTKLEALTEILKALEKNNLMGEVQQVDMTFLYKITLWYQDRFEIRLGEPVDLTLKVDYMTRAIAQLAVYQIGVLDVTFGEEQEVRFIPEQG